MIVCGDLMSQKALIFWMKAKNCPNYGNVKFQVKRPDKN